jgi:hypothetical protein
MANTPAILVTGSYMHLKGLEIANSKVGASGNHSYSTVQTKGASYDTFELLNLHHGFGAGLFIDDTKGGGGHLILNCDSHDNYDINGSQGDGQNADGFGHHYQESGATSTFRGCRSWWNSDDGYDFIYQDVPLIVENCWAMGMGHPVYGTASPADGNGNGFKMGGNVTNTRHMIRNCVAWKNKDSGFYSNHSTGLSKRHGFQHAVRPQRRAHPAHGGAGPYSAQQHQLYQQDRQHGRGRHAIQHLGSQYHA